MVTFIIVSVTAGVILMNWRFKVLTKRLEEKMPSRPQGRSISIK